MSDPAQLCPQDNAKTSNSYFVVEPTVDQDSYPCIIHFIPLNFLIDTSSCSHISLTFPCFAARRFKECSFRRVSDIPAKIIFHSQLLSNRCLMLVIHLFFFLTFWIKSWSICTNHRIRMLVSKLHLIGRFSQQSQLKYCLHHLQCNT